MTEPSSPPACHLPNIPGAGLPVGKQLMALNALSQLNRQIAENPDFYSLLNLLLLTICGQCSVGNAFAAIRNPRSADEQPLYFATGQYEEADRLASARMFKFYRDYFREESAPLEVDRLDLSECPADVAATLKAHEVQLVMPLTRDHELIGVLGLGSRLRDARYGDPEIELLLLLVHAVSPFMATLSREYFDLFNSVRQGVMIFDAHELLVRINATALRILEGCGVAHSDSLTIYRTPLERVFPARAFPGWAKEIRRARSRAGGALATGLRATNRDGERVYNARISAINRRVDTQSDLLVILEDVTEQTNNEQRLYELQKFAEKGVMVSSIAHELNNHLALVLGGAEMIQRHLHAGNADVARQAAEKLIRSVGQMQRFTAGLMDVTRIQSKKTRVSLNTVISDVLAFIKLQKKFKQITLEVALDPDIPSFQLDADQIAQLLLNLLHNAADAIAEAKRDEGRIEVRTELSGQHAVLALADNGCGIPADVRDRLFQEQITTKAGGHGFGLMMCSKIIKDHRAEVKIDSETGVGTTFRFRLPLDRDDVGPLDGSTPAGASPDGYAGAGPGGGASP